MIPRTNKINQETTNYFAKLQQQVSGAKRTAYFGIALIGASLLVQKCINDTIPSKLEQQIQQQELRLDNQQSSFEDLRRNGFHIQPPCYNQRLEDEVIDVTPCYRTKTE